MLDWLSVPLGMSTYLTGRHYRRYTRRRRGAAHRLEASRRGEDVTVPLLWEDDAGSGPDSIPTWLNGYLTVNVRGGRLLPGSGHPALLGDFVDFWSRCLDDAAAGRLGVLAEPQDMLVQPRLPYPRGARALIVAAPQDWQVLVEAKV